MADITNLDDRRPEPEFWQCKCDCISFRLYADGSIECGQCGKFQSSIQGEYIPNRLERYAEQADTIAPLREKYGVVMDKDEQLMERALERLKTAFTRSIDCRSNGFQYIIEDLEKRLKK